MLNVKVGCASTCNAPINVKPQGGGVGQGVEILTFSLKKIQMPHPWVKIIGQNVHPAASVFVMEICIAYRSDLIG